ncbi:MAG: hypothetical protein IJA79_07575, partial [Desulfovibrio sp.]|nr:hypothetical protein [Desulfovibrio sp.]
SVQSEPESNSPVQICIKFLLSRNQNLKDFFFPLAIHLSMNDPLARRAFSVARCRFMHPFLQTVKNFFSTSFSMPRTVVELLFSFAGKDNLYPPHTSCQSKIPIS